jgi:hypothetical protein
MTFVRRVFNFAVDMYTKLTKQMQYTKRREMYEGRGL